MAPWLWQRRFAVALHAVVLGWLYAQGQASPPAFIGAGAPLAEASTARREGARLVEEVGTFRLTGDGVAFHTAAGRTLAGLENLSLERVARALGDAPGETPQWSVSGLVTEYRGANYLLVTRAVLVAKPQPARLRP